MAFGSKATNRQSTTVVVADRNNVNVTQTNNQIMVPCLIILNADTTFKVVLENGQPLPEGMQVPTHQIQHQVQQLQQRQRLQPGQQQQQIHRLPASAEHVATTGVNELQRRKKLLDYYAIDEGKYPGHLLKPEDHAS